MRQVLSHVLLHPEYAGRGYRAIDVQSDKEMSVIWEFDLIYGITQWENPVPSTPD